VDVVAPAYNPNTQEAEAGDLKFKASLSYIARPCLNKNPTDSAMFPVLNTEKLLP
jgi:hypothetical protein